VIITDPLEHPQGVLVAELHVEPGGRVAGAHQHPGVIERFQVVRGTVNYLIDGREVTLGPGGSAEAPAGCSRPTRSTWSRAWWSSRTPEALALVGADGQLRLGADSTEEV
jgi:Cupin domain